MTAYRRAKIVTTITENGTVLHFEDIGPAPMRESMLRSGMNAYWQGPSEQDFKDRWARAVGAMLDELMHPTPAMIQSVDAFTHEGRCQTCGGGLSEWQAMLQAAKDGK